MSQFLIKKQMTQSEAQRQNFVKNCLIECVQAKNLIKLTSLKPEVKVELNEHQNNYGKGILHSNYLRGITQDEIHQELQSRNICKHNKILKKEITI